LLTTNKKSLKSKSNQTNRLTNAGTVFQNSGTACRKILWLMLHLSSLNTPEYGLKTKIGKNNVTCGMIQKICGVWANS